MNDFSNLSERLTTFRSERKLTQKTVAEGIGVNIRVYQRYEAGYQPKLPMLARLADFYDLSLDELVGRVRVRETK